MKESRKKLIEGTDKALYSQEDDREINRIIRKIEENFDVEKNWKIIDSYEKLV